MLIRTSITAALLVLGLNGCSKDNASSQVDPVYKAEANSEARFDIYKSVPLTANIDHLSKDQRTMLREMFAAARIMDQLFWRQSFGNPDYLIPYVEGEKAAQFALANYGPWDRLNNNQPFLAGFGEKPLGAKFYPADMTKEEFDTWEEAQKKGLYSIVTRRDDGSLMLTPYSKAYGPTLNRAAEHLRKASALAEDPVFAEYLALRASALLDDNYQPSDLRWMDMTDNQIDFVVGPIETYEDSLFGYRAAFEAYILIKDLAWSEKLNRFVQYLPQLQRNLPVPEQYKQETVGGNSQLNAYDVVYYAGRANAGSKTIAINLPNDEEVQLSKGTRRLQLKNAMQAKFDHILLPIADLLIDPSQRKHITFDAFFANTMFHEVAHGLGIKKTIESGTNVRTALQETASAIEEGKADILGLYMVTQLHAKGELGDAALEDFYVTFMASIFRSVRFGAASAHGKANMIRFNYFLENGAFVRDQDSGTYRVDINGMRDAMANLSRLILTIQGDGDLLAAQRLLANRGNIGEQLAADLARLANANIPVDVSFVQGETQLGL